MRIASLCPSNTEICACLGLTEQLVGVDHYSDWPNEVRSLPDLGPDLQINMEKLAELKPDLIIASLSVPGMENNVEKLDQLGIPYIVLKPKRLADIYEDILRVGEACDCYGDARRLVEDMKTRVEAVAERCPDPPDPPRLYWEWWPRPVFIKLPQRGLDKSRRPTHNGEKPHPENGAWTTQGNSHSHTHNIAGTNAACRRYCECAECANALLSALLLFRLLHEGTHHLRQVAYLYHNSPDGKVKTSNSQ